MFFFKIRPSFLELGPIAPASCEFWGECFWTMMANAKKTEKSSMFLFAICNSASFFGGNSCHGLSPCVFSFWGKGRIVKPTGFQTPWGWRYLDTKNIPKTPSQEVFGRLGKGICFYLFWMLYFSSEFQNKTPSSTSTDPTSNQSAPSFKTHLPYFGQQASGLFNWT